MSDEKDLPSEGEDSPAHDVGSDDATDELGPQPGATTQSPELFPGGADAVRDTEDLEERGAATPPRDPDPRDNPATDDAAPQGVTEGDDKQQEPDEGPGEESPDEPPA